MSVHLGALKSFFGFLNTRIGQRFLSIFLAISLLPLAIVSSFALRSSETALREQTLATLRAASDGAEADVREYLQSLKQEMLALTRDETVLECLQSPFSNAAPGGSVLARALAGPEQRIPEVQEVFIMDPAGQVVASSVPNRVGRRISDADYFARGRQSFYCGDFFRDPANDQVTWIVTAPIRQNSDHHLIGVLAFRIDPDTLSALVSGQRVLAEGADTQSFRIENTGETYIVDRHRLMITQSRYLPGSVLKTKVDTLPVRVAFDRGQEITSNYRDYRGIEVSGASAILRDAGWVLITEIDFHQAFAPIERLRRGLLVVTIALGLVVVLLVWTSTRRIIRPIQVLYESDRALAIGDEAAAVIEESHLPQDELGELVRRRNVRVKEILAYQQKLQEQTAKLKDALGELEHMSYSIMHDMRAPLRAITGYGELILEKESAALSAESRDYLKRMRSASLRMDQLIRDVLNYAVIVRGELPLYPVEPSRLLRGIVESYPDFQFPRANISFPPDLPMVKGNEAALTQCFANLLENSVRFVEPHQVPHVRIISERVADRVRISAEDNGIGIPQPMQSRIFDLFERGSNSGPGTGVGLAIVRKAAERMGGTAGVVSRPGHGSTFWIELQAASPGQESENGGPGSAAV